MKKEYTPATLAPDLHVSVDSIRKVWYRLFPDDPFNRHAVLNGHGEDLLRHYAASPVASPETRDAALAILENRPPEPAPVPEIAPAPKPDPEDPAPDNPAHGPGKQPSWKRYQKPQTEATPDRGVQIPWWVIAVVLAPALAWQVEHYSHVVDAFSRISNPVTSYVFSLFFSFSVTGTAIVMTAAKGDIRYLYVFAVIETATNILYCSPATWTEWVTTVLISGAMAFTIFSYSEVFSRAFRGGE